MLYTRSREEAETLVTAFQHTWERLAPKIVQYLNRNYLDSEADRRRWMFCYREGVHYAWINTNSYIESWHNTLKKHFFKDQQKRRLDSVIYILIHKAIPLYRQKGIRHAVQVGRMTPARKKALHARQLALNHMDAKRAQDPDAIFLFQTAENDVLKVRSFTVDNKSYAVKANWSAGLVGHFNSCTCIDFASTKMCCKHIALATIELPHMKFYYSGHWEGRDTAPPMEEQADLVATIGPVSNQEAFVRLLKHYADDLSDMLSILDEGVTIPNLGEILGSLKTSNELCHKYLPVQLVHSLNRKHTRQR